MHLNKVTPIFHFLMFWIILFFIVSCTQSDVKKLTIDQILQEEKIGVPVWYINTKSEYKNLNVTYYYFDFQSELFLDTYFTTTNETGQITRVARLSVFYRNGQLIAVGESKEGPDIPVIWAGDGDASLCHIVPEAYRRDKITGPAYQTCMFWTDEENYQFKLYTIWSEEETELFVNSLENMRRPPPKKDKKSR